MKLLGLVLVLVAFADARPRDGLQASLNAPQIINGEDTAEGEFPWQLSLCMFDQHLCGAALLDRNTVLTAGHCIDGWPADILTIKAGMWNQYSDVDGVDFQTVPVLNYTQHENYNDGTGTYANDIGIIYLAEPVDIIGNPNIQGIDLPNAGEEFITQECIISGWGRIYQNISQELPDRMQKADTEVITQQRCQVLMEDVEGIILPGHICVYSGENGACSGDSGGPLSCRQDVDSDFKLAGVTSWGVINVGQGCAIDYPTAYTRVSEYLQWITDNYEPPEQLP